MSEHVTEWLNAFLDGELRGQRLHQVEEHLEGCTTCRHELGDLEHLSTMLKNAAPVGVYRPVDRFVAGLTLVLPERGGSAPSRVGPQNIGWWLVPVGAAVAWAFLQTGLTLSGLVSTARAAGLLGSAASLFSSGPQHTGWFLAALNLFGSQLGTNGLGLLNVIDSLVVLRSDLAARLAWQAGFGILYWAGLRFWWTHLAQLSALEVPGPSLIKPGPENTGSR